VTARRLHDLLGLPRGVLITASRDPDAKLTFVVTRQLPGTSGSTRLVVKIPVTAAAGESVDREGRMLVDLRRMCTGPLLRTFPRYVQSVVVEERSALVSTALPGAPMSVGYHQWLHTARRSRVAADFRRAEAWLTAFQTDTHLGDKPTTWPAETEDALRRRWDGHPCLDLALRRLQVARSHLEGRIAPTTAVHGDFWFGNVLVSGDAVTGVVDWENGAVTGCPLRDLARFPLSYALYLDRHTRPGHRVLGHWALRRGDFGAGVRYALLGGGWLTCLVRGFLRDGLLRLGLPPEHWYDVALIGIGEVAATANDEEFGRGHLMLLAGLPDSPPEPGRTRR
jgi:hypothetical protein